MDKKNITIEKIGHEQANHKGRNKNNQEIWNKIPS